MEDTLSEEEFARLPNVEIASYLARIQRGIQSLFLGAPVVADPDRIVTNVNWADGALSIAAQPDVPRNVTVAFTDANDSTTGLLTITGKDARGRTVVETMEPDGAGGGKTLTGTKIFASITSAVITDTVGALPGSDQLIIGVGDVIGTPMDLDSGAVVHHVYLGGVRIAVPVLSTGISESGIDVSAGTYDGSKILQAFLELSSAV